MNRIVASPVWSSPSGSESPLLPPRRTEAPDFDTGLARLFQALSDQCRPLPKTQSGIPLEPDMRRPRAAAPALLALTAALTAASTAACNGGPDVSDPPGGASPPVSQGGIEYTAETLVMDSFPVQLDTRVTMRNASS